MLTMYTDRYCIDGHAHVYAELELLSKEPPADVIKIMKE